MSKLPAEHDTLLQVQIGLWHFKLFDHVWTVSDPQTVLQTSATWNSLGRPKLCSNAEFNQARPFRGPQTLHQVLIHAEFLRGCHFDFELGNSTTHVIPGTRRPVDQLQVQSSIELFFRTLLYACLSASFDLFLGFNHAQIRQLRILTQHSTSTPF
ncbi:hypothetical protein B0H16DRAFT_1461814 [Mycena metata]|uniref:Uncharacterized protein n=1 Tax=Mycena metata TaxID=1033252 RepID=A0AAD7IPE0_9AGAR|nr:hypothetical protein B0H16DRAFT_1461814 [Mycena metata]